MSGTTITAEDTTFLTAEGGASISASTPVSPERIVLVAADLRTLAVAADIRALTVAADLRTTLIPAD